MNKKNSPSSPSPPPPLQSLTVRFMLSHPAHILSLGFGTGLCRIAPGTIGTLLGWLSFILLNRYLTPGNWAILIFIGFALGVWTTGYTAKKLGISDPSAANWDEVVAFWLVMLFVMPASFVMQLIAFLLFRFFDIVKPSPIRNFERRCAGGFGIMFDDILAAFFTVLVIALCTQIMLFSHSPYLSLF